MPNVSLADTVAALMPRAREDLAELVSYRSVADPRQFPKSECEKAAGWIAHTLLADGFQDVAIVNTPDGTQSVYGCVPGLVGSVTVLLYAHYDVQPPLNESAWLSPPFELTERDGRWYGRGAADIPRHRGVKWLEPGEAIGPDELEEALAKQGVQPQPGDVLIIRTGHWGNRKTEGPTPIGDGFPGLHAACAPLLRRWDIAMLAGDSVNDVLPAGSR